jgi:hypothetical protein
MNDPTGHVAQDPQQAGPPPDLDTLIRIETRVPGTEKVAANCQNPPAFSSCRGTRALPQTTPDAALVQQAQRAQDPGQGGGGHGRLRGAVDAVASGLATFDNIDDYLIGPGALLLDPGFRLTENLAEKYLFRTDAAGVVKWTPGVRQVWRNLPMVQRVTGGVLRRLPIIGIAATWASAYDELSSGHHDGVDTAIVIGGAILETALDFVPVLAPFGGIISAAAVWLARDLRKPDGVLRSIAAQPPCDYCIN